MLVLQHQQDVFLSTKMPRNSASERNGNPTMPLYAPSALQAKKCMKTAKKHCPKISKNLVIASKKSIKSGRCKLLYRFYLWRPNLGIPPVYNIVSPKVLKKKTKKRIVRLMICIRETILFLGGLFGLIYTLKELFFK